MSEHSEQCKLIDWCSIHKKALPPLWYIFAVPNGTWTSRTGAVKAVREGVKKGVPDLVLPYPVKSYHGLFIEMKWGKNKTSIHQQLWLRNLKAIGYKCIVCYSAIAAARAIILYLNEDIKIRIKKRDNALPYIIDSTLRKTAN